MQISFEKKDNQRDKNRVELGEAFDALMFVTGEEAGRARQLRDEILTETGDKIVFRHKRTKPLYLGMSPGCEI